MSAYSASRRSARSAANAASGRFAASVLAYARGRVDAYLQAREARKAYRHLMAMSDHQLRDIGVSRSEIKARVFGPASRSRSILD